jgi:hypothetical protein
MPWPRIQRHSDVKSGFTYGWDVDVEVEKLSGAALDCAYETARCGDTRDLMLCARGLLIALNDDVNFGWHYYAPRYQDRDEALRVIRERFGDRARVPIEATRIPAPTHTVFR